MTIGSAPHSHVHYSPQKQPDLRPSRCLACAIINRNAEHNETLGDIFKLERYLQIHKRWARGALGSYTQHSEAGLCIAQGQCKTVT